MGVGMGTVGSTVCAGDPAETGAAAARRTSATRVRVTGVLVEGGRLLVVRQVLKEQSNWNLPGGAPEDDETCEAAVVREVREETGLEVEVERLLYVTDRFKRLGNHVVDLCFSVKRTGGVLKDSLLSGGDGEVLSNIQMVPLSRLGDYGFSERFAHMACDGFPGAGSYCGDFRAFYG